MTCVCARACRTLYHVYGQSIVYTCMHRLYIGDGIVTAYGWFIKYTDADIPGEFSSSYICTWSNSNLSEVVPEFNI